MGGQGAWLELAKQGAWVESAREGDHGWSWQGPGVRAEPAARADGSMAGSMAKTRIPVYSGTALVAAEVRGGCLWEAVLEMVPQGPLSSLLTKVTQCCYLEQALVEGSADSQG